MTYRKISYSQAFLHIFFGIAMLLLQKIGNNAEPLALALVYAMPMASLSPLLTALSYFAVSLFSKNTAICLIIYFHSLSYFNLRLSVIRFAFPSLLATVPGDTSVIFALTLSADAISALSFLRISSTCATSSSAICGESSTTISIVSRLFTLSTLMW